MRVQINRWVPEEYGFQNYEEAEIIDGYIKQTEGRRELGLQFIIGPRRMSLPSEGIREMEGAHVDFYGGHITATGYVEDDGVLHREMWSEIPERKS